MKIWPGVIATRCGRAVRFVFRLCGPVYMASVVPLALRSTVSGHWRVCKVISSRAMR